MTKNWNILVHFTNIDSLLAVDCLILTENHKYQYNEKEQTHVSSKNNIRHLSTFKNISTLNEIQWYIPFVPKLDHNTSLSKLKPMQ